MPKSWKYSLGMQEKYSPINSRLSELWVMLHWQIASKDFLYIIPYIVHCNKNFFPSFLCKTKTYLSRFTVSLSDCLSFLWEMKIIFKKHWNLLKHPLTPVLFPSEPPQSIMIQGWPGSHHSLPPLIEFTTAPFSLPLLFSTWIYPTCE